MCEGKRGEGSVFNIDDADLNAVCNSDCTIIEGQFTTERDVPIQNLELALNWEFAGAAQPSITKKIRKIMTGTTDANGFYRFTFYAKDEELIQGEFVIDFNVSNKHYLLDEYYSNIELHNINKRDTLLEGNFHIPKRGGKVKVKVRDIESQTAYDQLNCSVGHKYGLLNRSITHLTGSISTNGDYDSICETAVGQYTYIQL